MAIVKQLEQGNSCTVDERGVREYTRKVLVKCDTPEPDPYMVGTSLGVSWWDAWPADANAYFRSASIAPNSTDAMWFDVVLTYSNAPLDAGMSGVTPGGGGEGEMGMPSGPPGGGGANVTPTSRGWTVNKGSVKFEEVVEQDLVSGKPIAFSNGQAMDPPVTRPARNPTFTFVGYKHKSAESFANTALYEDKVNAAVWYGFPAGSVRCNDYKLEPQYEHGDWWWKKTVEVEIRQRTFFDRELGVERTIGWNPRRIVDMGLYTLTTEGGGGRVPKRVKDLSGEIATSPLPFDGAGKPLTVEQILSNEFKFLEFNVYPTADFTNLL